MSDEQERPEGERSEDEAAATEEPQAPADEQSEAAGKKAEGSEKKDDSSEEKPAPGAELDPIAIEERELSAEERARVEAEAEERARLEAAATAEAVEQEPVARRPATVDASTRVQATGKRKRSVARVLLQAGSGEFLINERSLENYFPRPNHQAVARQPLAATGYAESVDVRVRVHGGGISGQAGAVSHGIARALTELDPELRRELKQRGLLRRDARIKERRKAGLKKARKRPQFSKR
jgi:small subunit ribosomal protein S9